MNHRDRDEGVGYLTMMTFSTNQAIKKGLVSQKGVWR
jgi:hypothetical protein